MDVLVTISASEVLQKDSVETCWSWTDWPIIKWKKQASQLDRSKTDQILVLAENQGRKSKVIKETFRHTKAWNFSIWQWCGCFGALVLSFEGSSIKSCQWPRCCHGLKDVMWLKLPCGECTYISHISQIIPRSKNNEEKLYSYVDSNEICSYFEQVYRAATILLPLWQHDV